MTANRRERVLEPTGCDNCTNKTCLMPGPRYGQPCDLVENWLNAKEKGSSISREHILLVGDESFIDKLAFDAQPEPEPVSLDHYGIKSLRDFSLTEKQREAIKMFFYDNKRVSQIAAELKISSEAVLDRIEHGKARIEKQLNRAILFREYLEGKLIDDIFVGTIKNSMLAKIILEAYFIACQPAGEVVQAVRMAGLETTLGVVYKYVNTVKLYLEPLVSDEHKKALTNFSY